MVLGAWQNRDTLEEERNNAIYKKFAELNVQGCKIYRHCVVAVLIGRKATDMKNVQITGELFVTLIRYFVLDQHELYTEIRKGLEQKVDAMLRRELFTKYKTAPTDEEKEQARQKYLDMVGMQRDFRW
jgi:hypothetical protein